jgi:hypothetical protein
VLLAMPHGTVVMGAAERHLVSINNALTKILEGLTTFGISTLIDHLNLPSASFQSEHPGPVRNGSSSFAQPNWDHNPPPRVIRNCVISDGSPAGEARNHRGPPGTGGMRPTETDWMRAARSDGSSGAANATWRLQCFMTSPSAKMQAALFKIKGRQTNLRASRIIKFDFLRTARVGEGRNITNKAS